MQYAMSVMVGRALPDARDGLKPVHRRLLFSMDELGLHHSKPFRKSARVVGDVLGKYHPHGDQAVYDALVRLAQPFAMAEPLVDGHGNFGSVDNDPAAAMRYFRRQQMTCSEQARRKSNSLLSSAHLSSGHTGTSPLPSMQARSPLLAPLLASRRY